MPSMQYDVKSAYTTTDAALVPYRVRLKGAFITSETGGATPVTFYDNATTTSNVVALKVGVEAPGCNTVMIPGEGILCENGIYVTVGSADSVTIFYG